MNNIDNINPCALSDNEMLNVGPRLNTVFNILGVMFFVVILIYLALHCL